MFIKNTIKIKTHYNSTHALSTATIFFLFVTTTAISFCLSLHLYRRKFCTKDRITGTLLLKDAIRTIWGVITHDQRYIFSGPDMPSTIPHIHSFQLAQRKGSSRKTVFICLFNMLVLTCVWQMTATDASQAWDIFSPKIIHLFAQNNLSALERKKWMEMKNKTLVRKVNVGLSKVYNCNFVYYELWHQSCYIYF